MRVTSVAVEREPSATRGGFLRVLFGPSWLTRRIGLKSHTEDLLSGVVENLEAIAFAVESLDCRKLGNLNFLVTCVEGLEDVVEIARQFTRVFQLRDTFAKFVTLRRYSRQRVGAHQT